MHPIGTLRSRTVVLSAANIDTDQIIPARFLTTTTREGLGRHLFADWRYDGEGALQPDFVLNGAAARECAILVAGRNFGCGSSREHAPWALLDYGVRAVISTQIADIFRSNALKNGLVPVVVDEATSAWLIDHPGIEVTIDLPTSTLSIPGRAAVRFPLETFARYCLVNGIDELGFLMEREAQISAFERSRA